MDHHPLPWTVEYDWCVEIYDTHHRLVIKLMSDADARELVSIAGRLSSELAAASIEIERMLNEPEV